MQIAPRHRCKAYLLTIPYTDCMLCRYLHQWRPYSSPCSSSLKHSQLLCTHHADEYANAASKSADITSPTRLCGPALRKARAKLRLLIRPGLHCSIQKHFDTLP